MMKAFPRPAFLLAAFFFCTTLIAQTDPIHVDLVAILSLFGWLNRWNDTLATALEEPAVDFGRKTLANAGWTVGKHA